MCADGELHAFLALATDVQCINNNEDQIQSSEFVGTSTPALTDESGEEEKEAVNEERWQKRPRAGMRKVPLIFRDDSCVSLRFFMMMIFYYQNMNMVFQFQSNFEKLEKLEYKLKSADDESSNHVRSQT